MELQGCRRESEKEWESIAPTSVQTRCLVSAQHLTKIRGEISSGAWYPVGSNL